VRTRTTGGKRDGDAELLTRNRIAVLVALLGPFVVSVGLVPFRDSFNNTNAALLLVLVIVAVAVSGNRVAGVVTALSAAVWFDFFLTRPYQTLAINDRDDVETTVLLLAVGVGVTELAAWGYRQQAHAHRDAGYLDGIRAAAEAVATGGSSSELIEVVSGQLTRLLGLRTCHFQYGVAGLGKPARLRNDGAIELHGEVWDVETKGLPTDKDIELLVESKGQLQGRFLLTARPDAHPSMAQRLVAVTLADQVGASLR
jgi:K+-sensing histidine kinase KdpD